MCKHLSMISKREKRPRGRPPSDAIMEQIAIRFPKPMLAAIDEMMRGRLDRPDRSAVIRELLAEAIAARQAKPRGKG
jgi:metal-responsive CopG/Arc/MetJ family transcriptional regulator